MRLLPLLLILLLTSCSNAALQSELTSTKMALAKTETALKTANQRLLDIQKTEAGQLVHVVFFKVKEEAIDAMIAEIKKLEAIPAILDLEIGTFKNFDDPRALAAYNLVMEISFADESAYEIYQKHQIHAALKSNTKEYLKGPPATYDYIEK